MAGRGRPPLGREGEEPPSREREPRPRLYTAQDVARFCEVDLKTIHHWADAGKIPHHRTPGRHLRFRRNDLVRFLRAHGYPLHDHITSARPTIFLAIREGAEETAKKLSPRYAVRRFDDAAIAIAHLVAEAPDALVLSLADPTWGGVPAIAALKAHVETAWVLLVVVGEGDTQADLALQPNELPRLASELERILAVE
jgi:excisionase family DNA binding protein